MSATAVKYPEAVLNSSHRCDACSSRAYVVTVLHSTPGIPNGGELLFCAHHWAKHAEALTPLLSALVDETSQLTRHIEDDHHVN
jgi:hypothetical protein